MCQRTDGQGGSGGVLRGDLKQGKFKVRPLEYSMGRSGVEAVRCFEWRWMPVTVRGGRRDTGGEKLPDATAGAGTGEEARRRGVWSEDEEQRGVGGGAEGGEGGQRRGEESQWGVWPGGWLRRYGELRCGVGEGGGGGGGVRAAGRWCMRGKGQSGEGVRGVGERDEG